MSRRGTERWGRALAHLRAVDARWGLVIDQVGPCRLEPAPDRFASLARAISGQQVSGHAARSIFARLETAVGGTLTPRAVLDVGEEVLRGAGLSAAKARCLAALAGAVESQAVPLNRIGRLRDEAIVGCLTQVPGIGPWTAHMFLIFGLARPDVLAPTDLGIRVAAGRFEGQAEPLPAEACARLAEPWRPHRTAATWYLWRLLEHPGLAVSLSSLPASAGAS
jgi:DNA-3-methyladenine glycosylase II